MAKGITVAGLDVHKETTDVVIAEPGADGEVSNRWLASRSLRV